MEDQVRELEEIERELRRRERINAAREDVNAFVEYCFQDDEGHPIIQAELHRAWQDHCDRNRKKGVLGPRDHGKTVQLIIGRTIWKLGRNPNLRIKLVSATDDIAIKRLTSIKEHIENNPRVREVFPDLLRGPIWQTTQIYVKRTRVSQDPSIEACGILTAGTGGRADYLIFDDAVDANNALKNPALRPVVKMMFYGVWMNLLEPTGEVLYVATVWHRDDLTCELRVNPEYNVRVDIIDEDFTPIWPEKWTRERLMERCREITLREFNRGFRQIPMTDEDKVFTAAALNKVRARHLARSVINPAWPRYTGVDLAISDKDGSAYSVIFTLALEPNGTRWPVDIRRGRWGSVDTARGIIEVYRTLRPMVIYVENNAYQQSLLEWIDVLPGAPKGMPVKGFHTGKQKADPYVGLPSLAAEMENDGWKAPMADGGNGPNGEHLQDCECGICIWLSELDDYPLGKFKDTVMAGWFAREASKTTVKMNFGASSQQRQAQGMGW